MLLFLMTIEDPEKKDFLTNVYHQYGEGMLRIALQYLQQADAEDAVQDVFVHMIPLVKKLQRLKENELKAYLLVCTKNRACSILRKKKQLAEEALPEPVPVREAAPDTDLMLSLREEIERLPSPAQEILVLHDLVGFSYREIAAMLDMKEDSVQKLAKRTKKKIERKLLGKDGE